MTTSHNATSVILNTDNYHSWVWQAKGDILCAGAWECIEPGWSEPRPVDAAHITEDEVWLKTEWSRAQQAAKGVILETISRANRRLIEGKDAKAAWEELKEIHNPQTANHRVHVMQKIHCIYQQPDEELTAFLGRLRIASNAILAAYPKDAQVDTLLDALVVYIALSHLQQTSENTRFHQCLTINQKTSLSDITTAFRAEQVRRTFAASAKEEHLAAAAVTPKRQARRKHGIAKCKHCGKAHKSDDCWEVHPEKKPEWLKLKEVEDLKART